MFRLASRLILFAAIAALFIRFATADISASTGKLIVHEWGTFTALQDERGNAIGGINVDDEPVPAFVHNLNPRVLGKQYGDPGLIFSKGVPDRYPQVTMRLETPVMYFHLPKSQTDPLRLDVDVQFRGGWLTQFYPAAIADTPGLNADTHTLPPLNRDSTSRLLWKNVLVGAQGQGPKTDEPVWLAPRAVEASNVATPQGESERYLFYRGVGHVNSPLRAEILSAADTIRISPQPDGHNPSQTIRHSWLVDIQPDGKIAFKNLPPIDLAATTNQTASIALLDHSVDNLEKLKQQMHAALVEQGLFADEATAMLETWQNSYFHSGGLRLFFLVPQSWTDHYLPLTISQPAEIKRVMIGRIELISTRQSALLRKLADGPIGDSSWMGNIDSAHAENAHRFYAGRSDFGDLGVSIPPDYQAYLDLGRFRNALVIYEQSRSPTPSLKKFIDTYGLRLYQPADTPQPK